MTVEDALVILHCASRAPPETELQRRLVNEAERVAALRLKKIITAYSQLPPDAAEERHG